MVSLFPPTYNQRPNGLRTDIAEALSGLEAVSIPNLSYLQLLTKRAEVSALSWRWQPKWYPREHPV